MPLLERSYTPYVVLIAVTVAILLLALARLLLMCLSYADGLLKRFLPARVAYVLSVVLVVLLLFTISNKIVFRQALITADAAFLKLDGLVDEGIQQPVDAAASGSPESLIRWDSIGRRGKEFIVGGPTAERIGEFLGHTAKRPVRVYVGLRCGETVSDRAALALQELIRVGGFERSVLVVATPTGTGWLDPGAVDTLEYLHGGDTAIVGMQYSYLPSWITILVAPDSSQAAAHILFDKVYGYWRTLPGHSRPRLYLYGLSLGALGSETSRICSLCLKTRSRAASGADRLSPARNGDPSPKTATRVLPPGCQRFATERWYDSRARERTRTGRQTMGPHTVCLHSTRERSDVVLHAGPALP